MLHLTTEELQNGLHAVRQAPPDGGRLELIVRRPAVDERVVLTEAELDPSAGLVGDRWGARPGSRTPNPDTQVTIMNARAIALIAQAKDRWALAGDQLFLDMDLSRANLPAGTRLTLGAAVLEVSSQPHTGCGKFVARFGVDAMKFVNSPIGRELNLRGIYARVVEAGGIRVGDLATRR